MIVIIVGTVFELCVFGYFIYFFVADLVPAFFYHFFSRSPAEKYDSEDLDTELL